MPTRHVPFAAALTLVAATVIHASVLAAADLPSLTKRLAAAPLERIHRDTLPAPDVASLVQEDAFLDTLGNGAPFRYGVAIDVRMGVADTGAVEALADGTWLWRLRLAAPEAQTLSVAFNHFDVPPGTRVWVYDPERTVVRGPYTRADRNDAGGLWTPVVPGSEIVVEAQFASERALDRARLEVGSVTFGYRGFEEQIEKSHGSCNIDAICPDGNNLRNEIRAVARYTFREGGSTFLCTGTLLNNTARNLRPLFVTANHCMSSNDEVSTIVTYWKYQAATCGTRNADLSASPTQSGARLLATYGASDTTLIELNSAPPAAAEPFWMGWDASGAVPPGGAVIHHPAGHVKSLAFDDNPLTSTDDNGNNSGSATHWRVGDYERGTTEQGSSGSCILHPNSHRCFGTLTGGLASCADRDEYDVYGKLSVAWNGGGSASSRLRDHLDPGGTGALVLDGTATAGGGGGGNTGNPGPCAAGSLCLLNGRFEVTGTWNNQYNGTSGVVSPTKFTDFSGYFTFDSPTNPELTIKILDFGGGSVKVFYSQLSDLRFNLRLRETATGRTKNYGNGPGECGAIDQSFYTALAPIEIVTKAAPLPDKAGTCVPGPQVLCVLDNRFRIEVTWRNHFNGASGKGFTKALPGGLSGTVHFGDPNNIEQLVKMLNFDGRILLFVGSMSDFEYTVKITDTTNNVVKNYFNSGGHYCGIQDPNFSSGGGGGGGGGGTVNEVEPNDSRTQAQFLSPLPVTVRGNAETSDGGDLSIPFDDGTEDDIEDLYRITLSRSGGTISLTGLTADLDIYLIDDALNIVEASAREGTSSESFSLANVAAGSYYVGVTIYEDAPINPASAYTLTITP